MTSFLVVASTLPANWTPEVIKRKEGRERERERERGRNKESMYEKKEKGVDEKIWQTTERGKERVEMERWYRKREIVGMGEA